MRPSVRAARKVFGLLFLCAGTAVFVWGASASWALRDGLGPGGVTSHGAEAVWRFVKDFSEFFYISAAFWWAGALLLRRTF
jgi:hypothetical protein